MRSIQPSHKILRQRLAVCGSSSGGLKFQFGGSNGIESFLGTGGGTEHCQKDIIRNETREPGQDPEMDAIIGGANQKKHIGEMSRRVAERDWL